MASLLFCIAFAFLNRGRGSHFWDQIDSTVASRLVACFGMAALTMVAGGQSESHGYVLLLWTLATLPLWAFPGWDNYWAAAIGHDFNPVARTFPPVDWVMKRMPWFRPVYRATASDLRRRLWGAASMGLRQALAAPCIIGLASLTGLPWHALYALGTLLFGFIYMISGSLFKPYVIGTAEYIVGGALGFLVFQTIQ